MKKRVIVIGSGIVGLAMARALAIKGNEVTVIERHNFPVGASIRNFGMVWPIGQPDGVLHERAQLSKSIWKEITADGGFWHEPVGSLHLAYNNLELQSLEAFYTATKATRNYQLLNASHTLRFSSSIVSHDLKGSLYSPDEMIVDSPTILAALPNYFETKYGIQFHFNTHVTQVETCKVYSGKTVFEADEIFICTGPDFENLFPDLYTSLPITKCKLQMMRMGVQPNGWRMGPSLCGGLSLTHYPSFKSAGSIIDDLKNHFSQFMKEYVDLGIHVMVSQNQAGELIIGDSHEYGPTHDPFEREEINVLILNYLKTFARFENEKITHHWNGVYTKMTDGSTELILHPLPGVTVVNGLGGNGMTLSFGLAHQLVNS
jgi:FAD dependent oxidoreductase TIGR03364